MVTRINEAARWISNIINPYPITLALLLAVAYTSSINLHNFALWAFVIFLSFIALPLSYILIKNFTEKSNHMRLQEPTAFFRKHRSEIWILGIVSMGIMVPSMIFLGASADLYGTFAALLGTSLAIAVVNRYFKASFHLAAITSVVIVVTLIWGYMVLPIVIIIPLVAWARYSLKQHTPYQLAAGFGLAIIISVPILYYFIHPTYLVI
jgi:1,4-dihydroxy-2-naphthoate octaprenyltransferase